jgi:hypothetical protein
MMPSVVSIAEEPDNEQAIVEILEIDKDIEMMITAGSTTQEMLRVAQKRYAYNERGWLYQSYFGHYYHRRDT